ncbi:MAG: DUF2461 domain-containing protein [Bacteroidaceae bacterium]|nr:DUF2461 domain-containing protein [Bacteroidaceae bacterium]
MKEIIRFLSELSAHNNREWFSEHKQIYLRCKERFEAVTQEVIAGIGCYDASVANLRAKDCTYRIYRDTRFSPDKSPYKIHMGAFIVPGGKKSGHSGYYFQVGARDDGYPGGCMLATGDYCCDPAVLRILREDICGDFSAFEQTLRAAPGFELERAWSLKKTPKGFPADQPCSPYLRLKAFCLIRNVGVSYMQDRRVAERIVEDFRCTKPFLDFINRAVDYHLDGEPV